MWMGFKTVRQAAALPFVVTDAGVELLLITSRRRGRWIVPKGWPKAGRSLAETAREEALEEAGVVGSIDPKPLGSYRYEKQMRAGYGIGATVFVYPLLVAEHRLEWREKRQRRFAWYPVGKCANLVDDSGLGRLIAKLSRGGGGKLKDIGERLARQPAHNLLKSA